MKQKTGECYWRDDAGQLWLAESFVDEHGTVETLNHKIDEPGATTHEIPA